MFLSGLLFQALRFDNDSEKYSDSLPTALSRGGDTHVLKKKNPPISFGFEPAKHGCGDEHVTT